MRLYYNFTILLILVQCPYNLKVMNCLNALHVGKFKNNEITLRLNNITISRFVNNYCDHDAITSN